MFVFSVSFDDLQKLGPIFGFLGIIIGLIFSGLQTRKNTQIQRAKFLVDLADRDLDKDGAWDLFFKIESGQFKITNMDEFDQGKESVALDALLYHFNLLGRLVRMGVISLSEADFYHYEIETVFKSREVLEYLEWSEKRNNIKLYPDARKLAKRL